VQRRVVWSGRSSPTFQRRLLPPYAGPLLHGAAFLKTVIFIFCNATSDWIAWSMTSSVFCIRHLGGFWMMN
jgi:hypothetical protein